MKITASKLVRFGGLAAVAAGLLFVLIQPMHPSDTLASVSTTAWVIVHEMTLVVLVLFVVGIVGIYARQVEEVGWLGLAGVIVLSLGLLLTAALVFLEAFIEPVLASNEPKYVDGLLGLVRGTASEVDLGAIPALWSASGGLFLGGCVLFGFATFRARILPRLASLVFAFGLPVGVIVASLLPGDFRRLAAVPIGLGLAWLGWALWSDQREASRLLASGTAPQPN